MANTYNNDTTHLCIKCMNTMRNEKLSEVWLWNMAVKEAARVALELCAYATATQIKERLTYELQDDVT